MNPSSDSKIFYGWYIVAVAFAANFITVGTGFYIFNAFMEPLCQSNNWTRTDVNMALVIAMILGYVSQIAYGTLAVKIGARILMTAGPFFAGFVFIAIGRVTELWQLYLVYVLLFLGNGAYGGLVSGTVVNNWFVQKRGRAMGISTVAVSLSGAVLPLAAMLMLFKVGMADTALYIGLFMMLLGPVAWLVVRDWPEDHGLVPDGAAQTVLDVDQHRIRSDEQQSLMDEPGGMWTGAALIKNQTFWRVGLAYAMVMTGVVGVMVQLKPRFTDIGFSDMNAMYLMAATALMGAFGKYFWGTLCDRFDPRRVVAALMAATGIGLGLALIKGSIAAVYAFVIIFGFAMGGVMSTYPIIVASLFGRHSFAPALKYMMLFLILQLGGPIAAGKSFDLTGSYDYAYIGFAVLAFGAAALILTVRRPGPPPSF